MRNMPFRREKRSPKGSYQLCLWINRNFLLILTKTFVAYNTADHCEQCVISTTSYIRSRMNLCTTLTIDNASGMTRLTIGYFCP